MWKKFGPAVAVYKILRVLPFYLLQECVSICPFPLGGTPDRMEPLCSSRTACGGPPWWGRSPRVSPCPSAGSRWPGRRQPGTGPGAGAAARQQAQAAYVRTHATPADTHRRTTTRPTTATSPTRWPQYNAERTAPAGLTGRRDRRPAAGGRAPGHRGGWQQFTTQPYNGQPANYTDPFWSNVGAGFSLVGGRVTALATTPDGAWFAGAADGGVWRSYDQGAHWTPVTDNLPDMSTGALAVDPVAARCGWAPARPTSRRTPTRATASTGHRQRRPVLAGRGRPGTTRSGRARSSASPSTSTATPTRPPTTACSAGTRPGTSGRRSSTRPARPTSRPTTSR